MPSTLQASGEAAQRTHYVRLDRQHFPEVGCPRRFRLAVRARATAVQRPLPDEAVAPARSPPDHARRTARRPVDIGLSFGIAETGRTRCSSTRRPTRSGAARRVVIRGVPVADQPFEIFSARPHHARLSSTSVRSPRTGDLVEILQQRLAHLVSQLRLEFLAVTSGLARSVLSTRATHGLLLPIAHDRNFGFGFSAERGHHHHGRIKYPGWRRAGP